MANLDYEPGPDGASYSRVGPLTPPTGADARPASSPSPLRYELAPELAVETGRRLTPRRGTHRRYKRYYR